MSAGRENSVRVGTEEDPGWGVPARISVIKTCQKCGKGVQGKKTPAGKKFPLKTIALAVKM